MTIRALVFDFDGLIADTETTALRSWQELYEQYAEELPVDRWLGLIGTWDSPWDPRAELEARVGHALEWERIEPRRMARERELANAQPLLPGVRAWLDAADRLRLPLAIASSSSREWVSGHLERLGIAHRFEALATRHDVERTKPDPALYRLAVRLLGVPAGDAVAVEDSLNGVTSAKAAGLRVIAVPGPLTAHLDYRDADLLLPSLDASTLDETLEQLA